MDDLRTVDLGELGAYVDERVAAGTFESADDVVQAGLTLLREQEAEREELRAAIREGAEAFEQGRYTSYTRKGDLARDLKNRLAQRQS